jgi:hypothetical protein
MEVAWHIKKDDLNDFPDGLLKKLSVVNGESDALDPQLESVLSKPDRIYIGDEFCLTRMPDIKGLDEFILFADKKDLSLTLLTPVLTDQGIGQCAALFDRLYQWNSSAEVVVNDLGVLFFLKKNYPGFQLSMGRLFNKGFKDPRLENKDCKASGLMAGLLNDCSFNHENIQVLAQGLGVKGFEQDLLPYADPAGVGTSRLKTAVYLPFGYVTTGRACFTAGLNQNSDTRFSLNGHCSSPCERHCLELKSPNLAFKLFQNGNTIFYLYTLSMIRALLEKARQQKFRLVYQGGLI